MAGRGHITLRGRVYYVVIDLPRDPLNPKRRNQKAIRTAARTKAEAERERTRILRELDTGALADSGRATVAEVVAQYLDAEAYRHGAATRDALRRALRKDIAPIIGDLPLAALTPVKVREWLRRLRAERKLAEVTLAHRFAFLHAVLASAVRLNLIARNPCDGVDRPSPPHEERAIWDGEQARRFLALMRGDPHEALWLTAIASGLRKGELLALRWSDLDLDRGALQVRRVVERRPGESDGIKDRPKSRHGFRRVTLPPAVVAALVTHREAEAGRRAARAARGLPPGDPDLVFPTRFGTLRTLSSLNRPWFKARRAALAAGLPHIRFHDLRHLSATLALQAGVDPKTLSARLGHHSAGFTLDRYGHVTREMEDGAAAALGRVLFAEGDGEDRLIGDV